MTGQLVVQSHEIDAYTAEDFSSLQRYLDASLSASTRRAYESRWSAWEAFVAAKGVDDIPASPLSVAMFVSELANSGKSVSTINQSLAAIKWVHEREGHPNPGTHPAIKKALQGVRRTVGVAPKKQAHALTTLEVKRMLDTCDDGVRGIRDKAIILIGYAGGFRRSELAAAQITDIVRRRDGIQIRLSRSKGDQEGAGDLVSIIRGEHADTDPVTALDAWLTLIGDREGPIFRPVSRHNSIPTSTRGVTGQTVDLILKDRATRAGLTQANISGHSLRAGHVTEAAEHGANSVDLARQVRHESVATTVGYMRPVELMAHSTSRLLGL